MGWRLDEYAKGKGETGDPRHPTVTPLTPCLTSPHRLF
ncbi:hypothetical protein, partial [Salmonella enterica]